MDSKDSTTKNEKTEFSAQVRYLGSSLVITIPRDIVRKYDLKLGDPLTVTIKKDEK